MVACHGHKKRKRDTMTALVEFIKNSFSAEWATLFISMLPIVELRGGIPFGIAMGLDWYTAMFIGVLGNMIPVPFIIWFIRPVLNFLRRRKCFAKLVAWQERKMKKHSASVAKYSALGLFLFVAIPLPGTGAWTGAMVSDFLDMKMSHSLISICAGVIVAAALVTVAAMGVVSGLEWLIK